jgi:hypothetical protein
MLLLLLCGCCAGRGACGWFCYVINPHACCCCCCLINAMPADMLVLAVARQIYVRQYHIFACLLLLLLG